MRTETKWTLIIHAVVPVPNFALKFIHKIKHSDECDRFVVYGSASYSRTVMWAILINVFTDPK